MPIKKQPSTSQTISEDTSAIVQAGESNGPSDFLVLSFMTKMELMSLVYVGPSNFVSSFVINLPPALLLVVYQTCTNPPPTAADQLSSGARGSRFLILVRSLFSLLKTHIYIYQGTVQQPGSNTAPLFH